MRPVFLQCGNMISIHPTLVHDLRQRLVNSYACVKRNQLNAMLFLSSTIKDVEHRQGCSNLYKLTHVACLIYISPLKQYTIYLLMNWDRQSSQKDRHPLPIHCVQPPCDLPHLQSLHRQDHHHPSGHKNTCK